MLPRKIFLWQWGLAVAVILLVLVLSPVFSGSRTVTSDITVGPLQLHLYSVFFALGLISGYICARRWAGQLGFSVPVFDNLVLLSLAGGIIGARAVFVLGQAEPFSWTELLVFWQGGLSFYGGLLGAALASAGYWLIRRFSFLVFLDSASIGLALGQAIGRWGNFFNYEAFGSPTDLPWKMFVPLSFRPPEYSTASYFHPVFLYEFLGLALLTGLLWQLQRRAGQYRAGLLFGIYAVIAGTLRFFLEFLRVDALRLPLPGTQASGLLLSQVIAMVLVVCGLVCLWQAGTAQKT